MSDLFQASKAGNLTEVVALLAGGANVNATDNYGVTSLHDASMKGRGEVAKVLLAGGANVNAKDCPM